MLCFTFVFEMEKNVGNIAPINSSKNNEDHNLLHIPNSAGGNCLTGKENHTLCLKSDINSINLRITKI